LNMSSFFAVQRQKPPRPYMPKPPKPKPENWERYARCIIFSADKVARANPFVAVRTSDIAPHIQFDWAGLADDRKTEYRLAFPGHAIWREKRKYTFHVFLKLFGDPEERDVQHWIEVLWNEYYPTGQVDLTMTKEEAFRRYTALVAKYFRTTIPKCHLKLQADAAYQWKRIVRVAE
jgi:hypothetical protein